VGMRGGDEVLSAAGHRETLNNAADSVAEGGKRRRAVWDAVRYRRCCLPGCLGVVDTIYCAHSRLGEIEEKKARPDPAQYSSDLTAADLRVTSAGMEEVFGYLCTYDRLDKLQRERVLERR
jgi:hypothetical protein